MHIVMGGTGGVGSAVAKSLLDRGEAVKVITRDTEKAKALADPRVVLAEADVNDTAALREVFRTGSRAFLLNPPGDPTQDNEAQELRSSSSGMSGFSRFPQIRSLASKSTINASSRTASSYMRRSSARPGTGPKHSRAAAAVRRVCGDIRKSPRTPSGSDPFRLGWPRGIAPLRLSEVRLLFPSDPPHARPRQPLPR